MRELKSLRHFEDHSVYSRGVELIRRTQGENSVSDTHVENYANGDSSAAFGAFENGVLIGIATAKIESRDEVPVLARLERVVTSSNDRIGYLRSLSVDPAFQNQGLGLALTVARLDWFKERNCSGVFAISWANGSANTSGRIFRKLNFDLVDRIEGFYRDALLERQASCFVCGTVCACAAEVFYKSL